MRESGGMLQGKAALSREFATREKIGALAVFLCPNDAAQIRGATLPVDGGWLVQ